MSISITSSAGPISGGAISGGAISGSGSSASAGSANNSPAVQSDVQVKHIKAQIQDWSTCPTTDPSTKKQIVDKLESQLQIVIDGINSKSGVTGLGSGPSNDPSKTVARSNGSGFRLDISV